MARQNRRVHHSTFDNSPQQTTKRQFVGATEDMNRAKSWFRFVTHPLSQIHKAQQLTLHSSQNDYTIFGKYEHSSLCPDFVPIPPRKSVGTLPLEPGLFHSLGTVVGYAGKLLLIGTLMPPELSGPSRRRRKTPFGIDCIGSILFPKRLNGDSFRYF